MGRVQKAKGSRDRCFGEELCFDETATPIHKTQKQPLYQKMQSLSGLGLAVGCVA